MSLFINKISPSLRSRRSRKLRLSVQKVREAPVRFPASACEIKAWRCQSTMPPVSISTQRASEITLFAFDSKEL
jgi:hypothetical protein